MQRRVLLVIFMLFSAPALFSQAPGWQWAKDATSSSPETAWDVSRDAFSGNVYTAGSFIGNLSSVYGASLTSSYGSLDGFLAKYDPSGNVLWAIKIGGTNNDEIHSVATDGTGNVYVTGYFTGTADFDPSASTYALTSSGGSDGFLAKFSSAGAFLWAVKFGGNADEDSWKMAADANGVYITGSYQSLPATFNSYSSAVTKTTTVTDQQLNMFGAKYNSNGIVQWVISGGGDKDDIGFNMVADATNIYFIGRYDEDMIFKDALGVTSTVLQDQQNNKPQVYIIAVTQAGSLLWKTNITSSTGGDMVIGWGITQDANSLYVTGYFDGNISFKYPTPTLTQNLSAGGNLDLYLAKLSKTGNFIWNTTATGNGTGEQIGRALDIDASGNIILSGCYTTGLNYSGAGGPNFTSAGGHDVFVTAYNNAGTFLWSTKAGGTTRDYVNGLSVDNSGAIYICGEQDGGMIVGTTTLTTGGGKNVFLSKLGCTAITNNTIAASQTLCAGTSPATFTGSAATGAGAYLWQVSANSVTWTAAPGTFTNQNYSAASLTATTYFRRIVSGSGSCSTYTSASTNLTVSIDPAPSIAAAGPNQTVCAATGNFNANQPSTGTGAWTVLSGGATLGAASSFSSAVTNLGVGINQFVWTITNGVCSSSTSTVTIIRNDQPASFAGTNQTLCAASATMAATSPTVGSGAWTLLSGTGNITSSTSPGSQITGLGTGTNSFVWTVSNGTCVAATSTVLLIRDVPPVSNAGLSQTVCSTSATLAADNPTVGSGIWSVISGSGVLASASSFSSQVNSLSVGTNSFVWTVSNGTCVAATSTVLVIRDAQPFSNAGSSQTVCSTSATLAANNPTVGSGIWSVISGSGVLASSSSFSSQVNSLSVGTNSLVWTVSNGTCAAATSTVTVIRNAQPASFAGANQTLCAASATMAATSPTVGSGAWTLLSGSGNITSPASPGSQITGLGTGTNSFVWTVSNGTCAAATSTVLLIRDVPPVSNAGLSQTVCSTSVTLAADNPTVGSGIWSVISGSGALASASSFSSQVNSLSVGTNSLVWTVSNGTCAAATSTVTVIRNAQPASFAGTNQTLCAAIATMAATSPTVGSGAWTLLSGTGNITSPASPGSQITGLGTGTNSFVWTVSNGTCVAATSTVLLIRDVPPFSNAGSSQTVCSTSATLAANNPTVGSGIWSVISGSGVLPSASSFSSQVNSLSVGTNSLVWTVSNGTCAAATSTVTVIRNAQPASFAGTNQTLCAAIATMAATSPTVGSGAWTLLSGTGNITSPASPGSQITGLGTGTNSFVWTVSNGTCVAATSTVFLVRDVPPVSNAGLSQTVCSTSATLAANNPTVGSGIWSVISGSGVLASSSSFSSQVNSLSVGTNSLVWTVSNGTCAAATSTVTIIRNAQPASFAGTNQTLCAASATMAATSPTVGSGAWTLLSGSGNITSPASPGSQITGLGTGTNSFVWTVSNGTCVAATSTVLIIRDVQAIANAGTDQATCLSTATLTAVNPAVGTGSWSLVSGSGSIVSPSSPTSQVLALGSGTNTFLWTVSSGNCPAATSSVNIVKSASLLANAGFSQAVCSSNATLNATAPSVGTGSWSVVSGGAAISTHTNSGSEVTALSYGLNIFLWTVSNGICLTATSSVNVWRDTEPLSNAGTDQTLCTATATLSAQAPTLGVGVWSLLNGTGVLLSVTSATTVLTSLATGSNVFRWTVSNGVCLPATSTVMVVRDLQPIALAGSDQTICASGTSLAATPPIAGSGAWSIISGTASINSSTNANTAITSVNTGTTLFLWTVNNGSCPPATSTVAVYRDAQPSAFAGGDQTLCATTATLAATQPTVGIGSWSVLQGNALINAPSNVSTAVTSLGTGTNSFLWTVTNGVCPAATSTVTVIGEANPGTANAGADFTVCSAECTLSATAASPGTASWSVFTGNSSLTTPALGNSGVSNLTTGLNQFIWSNTNGTCPPSLDTLSVFFTSPLPAAVAGQDQQICASECTLTANNAGYGTWSVISGNASITNISGAVTSASLLSSGKIIFVWSVSKAFCPVTSDTVIIERNATMDASNAGSDQRVCGSEAKLYANTPVIGNGRWVVLTGAAVIANKQLSETALSGLSAGDNTFIWEITNGVCPASADTVVIKSDEIPSEAKAGIDLLVCSNEITLNATPPQIGNGKWSLISGTCSIAQPTENTTALSGLVEGIHLLKWSISNGVCNENADTLTITRTFTPLTPDAGSDQVIETSTAQMGANIPQAGIGTWSVISGSCEFSDIHDKNAFISKLPFGNTLVRWTIVNKSCPDVMDDLLIHVKDLNIPNAFSPNGDGINDRFTITSLDYYKEVKISIYNRWGTLLYHNPEYKNNWDGANANHENLADDTYYYIIEIPELKNFTGFITVKRDK